MCINGIWVFVYELVKDVFVEKLLVCIGKMVLGDLFDLEIYVGLLISEGYMWYVFDYIEKGK